MTMERFFHLLGFRQPQLVDVFQLDNLLKNSVPFVFVDLSEKKFWGEKIDRMLARAERMDTDVALKALLDRKIDIYQPIIVVCESGKFSSQVALGLTRKGFKNAYALSGGLQNALSLLEPS